jgi:hypothetical protein
VQRLLPPSPVACGTLNALEQLRCKARWLVGERFRGHDHASFYLGVCHCGPPALRCRNVRQRRSLEERKRQGPMGKGFSLERRRLESTATCGSDSARSFAASGKVQDLDSWPSSRSSAAAAQVLIGYRDEPRDQPRSVRVSFDGNIETKVTR